MVAICILCWSRTFSSSAFCLRILFILSCKMFRLFVLFVFCSVLFVGYYSLWCCTVCLCVVFDFEVHWMVGSCSSSLVSCSSVLCKCCISMCPVCRYCVKSGLIPMNV